MPAPKHKILLVEHNEFIKAALHQALEIEGFDVVAVRTALEGLQKAKQEHFDVSVADYELPDANGVEFFLLLSRFRPDSVRILMTTYGELKTLSDIFRYGIDGAIEKPFAFKKLIVVIEENLQRKKRARF